MRRRRTEQLQDRFGLEYDRLARERGDRRAAESELRDRERRVERYELRDLDPDARQRYDRGSASRPASWIAPASQSSRQTS